MALSAYRHPVPNAVFIAVKRSSRSSNSRVTSSKDLEDSPCS